MTVSRRRHPSGEYRLKAAFAPLDIERTCLEVFNVFDHANYGRYAIQEASRNYGRRVAV